VIVRILGWLLRCLGGSLSRSCVECYVKSDVKKGMCCIHVRFAAIRSSLSMNTTSSLSSKPIVMKRENNAYSKQHIIING
jgi:hypothetical protein